MLNDKKHPMGAFLAIVEKCRMNSPIPHSFPPLNIKS